MGLAVSGKGVSAGDGVGEGKFDALAESALPQAVRDSAIRQQMAALGMNKLIFRMKFSSKKHASFQANGVKSISGH